MRPHLHSLAAWALVASTGDLTGVLAANSSGCGKEPTITDGPHTAVANGKTREFIIKLPANYDKNRPYRLIFTFHPLNGSARQVANGDSSTEPFYGLPPVSNNSAIFVSPNGQVAGSVGGMMGWANAGGEDVLFVDAIMEKIEAALCINQDLRFSTGFSYGGAISYALASLGGGPKSPIAFYQQHGTGDQVLPISGARQVRDILLRANGCTPVTPEVTPNGATSTQVVYKGCKEGFPATWVVFNGPHTPAYADAGSVKPIGGPNFWNFLSQFE
ncbi:hypothetical protein B0T14DRAFT_570410 [Immersiella caudata]|uniref:Feruloyl esterase C n=1 Tax=Immersiella caudata TaxID=314043 RepID=A0AA39WFK5_9PEZI|nr:hypothetical protein B0T14DRAFT_570410 [Immersiella caudata]